MLRINQHSPEQDQRNLDTLFLLAITLAAQRITNKVCKNNKDIYVFSLNNPKERLVYCDSPESLNSLPSMIFWTHALHFSKAKAYALLP